MLELPVPSTRVHGDRVADVCAQVGRRLGLCEAELEELTLAARLHDLGKLGIPESLLEKPGPLDEQEWLLMQRHPDIGAAILRRVPGLEEVAALVRFHHERWDGRGYPEGLAGEDIPLASRIVCACDAWMAMCEDRPYRLALSPEVARAELREGAGTQFDPDVIDALLELV